MKRIILGIAILVFLSLVLSGCKENSFSPFGDKIYRTMKDVPTEYDVELNRLIELEIENSVV